MEFQLSKIAGDKIHYERVAAIDGKSLAETEMNTKLEKSFFSKNSNLTLGELGCFLSHQKVWKKIVANSNEYCIVLEDDVVLSSKVDLFFSNSNWIPNGCPYIRLEKTIDPLLQFQQCQKQGYIQGQIYKLYRFQGGFGTAAYAIHKEFAKWLLKNIKEFNTQVDNIITAPDLFQKSIPQNLNCNLRLQLNPAIAIQQQFLKKRSQPKNLGNSTIKKKELSIYSKLKRELMRIFTPDYWEKTKHRIFGSKIRFLE